MASTDEPFDLSRFTGAQERVYDRALTELQGGGKRSHWMWFIFPQLDGLGRSPTAKQYAIKSMDEARHYLGHSVLGPRLVECAEAVCDVEGRSASEIFGFPDDLKLKSSMTLFASAADSGSVFDRVLGKYFDGEQDDRTLQLLNEL